MTVCQGFSLFHGTGWDISCTPTDSALLCLQYYWLGWGFSKASAQFTAWRPLKIHWVWIKRLGSPASCTSFCCTGVRLLLYMHVADGSCGLLARTLNGWARERPVLNFVVKQTSMNFTVISYWINCTLGFSGVFEQVLHKNCSTKKADAHLGKPGWSLWGAKGALLGLLCHSWAET